MSSIVDAMRATMGVFRGNRTAEVFPGSGEETAASLIDRITSGSSVNTEVEADEIREMLNRAEAESIAPARLIQTPRRSLGSRNTRSYVRSESQRGIPPVSTQSAAEMSAAIRHAVLGDIQVSGRPSASAQSVVGNFPFDTNSIDINDSDLEIARNDNVHVINHSNIGLGSDGNRVFRNRIAELEALNSRLVLDNMGLRADLAIKKHNAKNGRWPNLWN